MLPAIMTSTRRAQSQHREHRWVMVIEIKDYLQVCKQRPAGVLPISFNTWLGRRAYFSGELVGLNLCRSNFSEVCFNGATLRHCRLGGYFKGAQFIEAIWDHVTVAEGTMLDDTCLDGLTLKRCQFQTVTPLRLSMRSAQITQSNLAGLHLVGQLKLAETVWDEASYQTLPFNIQVQLKLLKQHKVV